MADPKIRVPANLIPTIQQVADYYGMPFYVLAATIQLGTNWTNSVDDDYVVQVAQKMAENPVSSDPLGHDDPQLPDWVDVAAKTFGGGASSQFRKRLGELVQENIPTSDDFTDADRWTYDKENPTPTSSYVRPRIGSVGGDKVVVGGAAAGASKYPNRAADIDDVGTMFQNLIGRPPKDDAEASRYLGKSIATVAAMLNGSPEGNTWREYGDRIQQARRWADSLSLTLTGRPLNNDEMRRVVDNGWAPGQLDSYLRSQPFGNTNTTIGQAVDLRDAMKKSFQKIIGRDPTEGEINWAVTNKIPTNHVDALAEQTKTGTVWGGDPEKFTTARSALRQIMNQFGIVVDDQNIDTNLVNQAVNGKWTADQMKQSIASGQMPGTPVGTTVDHYTTTKAMADDVWKTYFPTTTMPQSYTNQFLAMTPDQITMFVRSLPSPEAKANGQVIPVGVYNDARAVAQRALDSLGVVGRAPSSQEIGAFASGKFDVESITKHYATDPEVLKLNPGAQYGLSRDAYSRTRSDTEAAYDERFGGVGKDRLAADAAKAANPAPGPAEAEPDWLQAVFKEGLTAEQSAGIFDDYFKRRGTAPGAADIYAFKTRSKTVYSDYVGGRTKPEPAVAMAGTQPTLPGLGTSAGKRGFAS
jgi:hypothetical protein